MSPSFLFQKFFVAWNIVKDWNEVTRLTELQNLRELNMYGNILTLRMEDEGIWRKQVANLLKGLEKLDNVVLV